MQQRSNTSGLDVVYDIETYDNIATAAIASIGAVTIDIGERKIIDSFYCTIAPSTCKAAGLSFGEDTMNWWRQQSAESRKALTVNNIPLRDALQQFINFIPPKGEIATWGMMDSPIIQHACRKVGLPEPFEHWRTFDLKTLSKFFNVRIDRDAQTHHHALHDAVAQAKFLFDLVNPVGQQ